MIQGTAPFCKRNAGSCRTSSSVAKHCGSPVGNQEAVPEIAFPSKAVLSAFGRSSFLIQIGLQSLFFKPFRVQQCGASAGKVISAAAFPCCYCSTRSEKRNGVFPVCSAMPPGGRVRYFSKDLPSLSLMTKLNPIFVSRFG